MVSVYFVPVSWVIYCGLYFPKPFKNSLILWYEWRLSVSVAIDFTSIVLPFFYFKKGSMVYLHLHGLDILYKNNGFVVFYSLMMLAVVPLAFIRVRISESKMGKLTASSRRLLDEYSNHEAILFDESMRVNISQ